MFELLDDDVIKETRQQFDEEGNASLFAVLLSARRARDAARSDDLDSCKGHLSRSVGILMSAVGVERNLRKNLPDDDVILDASESCPSPVSLQVAVRSVYTHEPRGSMTVEGIAPVFRALDDMSRKLLG